MMMILRLSATIF